MGGVPSLGVTDDGEVVGWEGAEGVDGFAGVVVGCCVFFGEGVGELGVDVVGEVGEVGVGF